MDVRGVSEGGASISPLFRPGSARDPRGSGGGLSALHATLRVKHFAGFADAGRGMGFRRSEGEWKGNVVREDNSIPVN